MTSTSNIHKGVSLNQVDEIDARLNDIKHIGCLLWELTGEKSTADLPLTHDELNWLVSELVHKANQLETAWRPPAVETVGKAA